MAQVTLAGDRVFVPGDYTVRFSRGHGAALSKTVTVAGSSSTVLSVFPSRWVEGHEVSAATMFTAACSETTRSDTPRGCAQVTVDACVEGTTDVIPHTENFLVEYKQWRWAAQTGIVHAAAGMCLAAPDGGGPAFLRNCSGSPKWEYDASTKNFVKALPAGGCLATSAVSTGQLRVNVTVAASGAAVCSSPSGQWTFDAATGFIASAIANSTGVDTPYAAGRSPLCLAARSEGVFNTAA